MVKRLLALMLLCVAGSAAAAPSAEALGMALVNAYRGLDPGAIVALHRYLPTDFLSVEEQRQRARAEWRALMRQYQLSGYRVSELGAAERREWQTQARPLAVVPVKKLVLELKPRQGDERLVSTHYIGAGAEGYFFIGQSRH